MLRKKIELCPPPGGSGHITFAFYAVRRPASHIVSAHFTEKYQSYLHQIWCLAWDCFKLL